ncbi:MAG: hypothetical protein RLZZ297_145 [Chloroflexota bacterium]
MQKLSMQSRDLTAAQLDLLRDLFPHVFTEVRDEHGTLTHKIDFDVLRQELSRELVDPGVERYQLTWPGKRNAILAANTPIAKTLRPQPDQSVAFDSSEHLFIEGDNLDALKLLQETYLGKVKLIYIDPPYNTGNDFIYRDNYAQSRDAFLADSGQSDSDGQRLVANPETHGRYHSDWLSMMYPRLKLARNLLREDGVIFISIDDNEVHNLKKMCDEIFGDGNFIASIIWQKKYAPQNDATYMSDMHDYVLVFAKNAKTSRTDSDGLSLDLLPRSDEQNRAYTNRDNDPRGTWKPGDLTVKSYSAQYDYPITTPSGRVVHPSKGTCWRVSREKFAALVADHRIWFGEDGNNVPSIKRFLSEVQDGVVPTTWWTYQEVGHNQEAKQELKKLFPETDDIFDTPKPVRLLRRIIELTMRNDPTAIGMDFFAGSATFAHALMAYNADDSGKRRYILVQENSPRSATARDARVTFPTIAEIAKERIRRAGAQILRTWESAHAAPSTQNFLAAGEDAVRPPDVGFRVLTIDSSNMREVFYRPDSLLQGQLSLLHDNIKADRSGLDLLFQVMLEWGVDLALPITTATVQGKTVYTVAAGALVACFETGIDEALVRTLAQQTPLRVVFRDSGFVDDATKINVSQIFGQLSPSSDIRVL